VSHNAYALGALLAFSEEASTPLIGTDKFREPDKHTSGRVQWICPMLTFAPMRRFQSRFVLLLLAMDGCGGATGSPAVSLTVSPVTGTVLAGTAIKMHAVVSNAPTTSIRWSISNPAGGSIDQDGLLKASNVPGSYDVTATSALSRAAAVATMTIVPGLPGRAGAGDLVKSPSPFAKVVPALRMYAVWWGDPAGLPPDAVGSVESLLASLPGSAHLAMLNQYMLGEQASVTFLGSLHDTITAPPTVNPSSQEVEAEICSVLHRNGIVPMRNDIYFVYPSTPTNPDKTGGQFCGRHYGGICDGTEFFIAWVATPAAGICGGPSTALDCAPTSAGTNLITNTSLHELFETMTNGLYPTWVDSQFQEVADKCDYNLCVPFGGNMFAIQPEYSNAHHACVVIE
jgi:hypothetical protein